MIAIDNGLLTAWWLSNPKHTKLFEKLHNYIPILIYILDWLWLK